MLFVLLLFSCATMLHAQTTSPCNDSMFIKLKARGVENLSEQEISYLNQKELECKAFLNANKVDNTKLAEANQAVQSRQTDRRRSNASHAAYKAKKGFGNLLVIAIATFGVLYALEKL